ncbi:TPA: hypothetical protein OVB50_002806 [Staphylococcus aureus]|nr:hypothetical protein [Staphylococcus aureus]
MGEHPQQAVLDRHERSEWLANTTLAKYIYLQCTGFEIAFEIGFEFDFMSGL